MSETGIEQKSGMTRGTKIRFLFYAIILLASFLWMQRNKVAPEAVETARFEAHVKENTEKQNAQALYATFIKKAKEAKDPAEELRVYEEILNTYKNAQTGYMPSLVAWSMYKKADLLPDSPEKIALIEELVKNYGHFDDRHIQDYVLYVVRERLKMAETEAEKLAICDNFLKNSGQPYSDGVQAGLLQYKAENTADKKEKIALYDTIISFTSSDDKKAFDRAINVALDKLELLDDPTEQLRLCDLVIEGFLKRPQDTQYYLFDRALEKKAKLVDDPSLPLKLWDQVIANNVTEESVMQARSQRIRYLQDDTARLAAYDETIHTHQNSRSDFVQFMVLSAMASKARLLQDPKAKEELWRAIIAKSEKIEDSRAKSIANQAMIDLAKSTGDSASATAYYDETIASSKDTMDTLRALRSKAEVLKDKSEKIAAYDEIIQKGANSTNNRELRIVQDALYKKAELIDNTEEKIKIYDTLLFADAHIANEYYLISSVFRERLDLTRENQEKLTLYDRYMNTYNGSLKPDRKIRLQVDRAEFLADPSEKLHIYTEIITASEQLLKNGENTDELDEMDKDFLMTSIGEAVLAKAELLDSVEDKIKLYDQYLAFPQPRKNHFSAFMFERILFKKADLIGDPLIKDRYFKEKIQAATTDRDRVTWSLRYAGELSKPERERLEEEIITKFFDNTDKEIERMLAVLLVRKLNNFSAFDEQEALCDRIIERYQNSSDKYTLHAVIMALSHKAGTAKDDATKLERYSSLINQYKDSDDRVVKRAVDEAIAAKFRLEAKMQE